MNTRIKTLIISIPLLAVSIYLVFFFYGSVKEKLDEKVQVQEIRQSIINRMKLLRELQTAYKSLNGHYASWAKLKDFAKNGVFYVTEKKQTFELNEADGTETVTTRIDTLRDADGEFKKDYVSNTILKKHKVKLKSLAYKGKDTANVNIEILETEFKVRGEKFRVKFQMETDTISTETSDYKIPVIQVRATHPRPDPNKRDETEINFGSLIDASTTGSWEGFGN